MAVKYKKQHNNQGKKTSSKKNTAKKSSVKQTNNTVKQSINTAKTAPQKNKPVKKTETKAITVKKEKKFRAKAILKHVLLTLLCIILAVLLAAVGLIYVFEKGPSAEIKELFVVTVQQSSAAKPLAYLFLSKDEVADIMARNTAKDSDKETDPELINIDDNLDMDEIIIENVSGATYRGKVMIINDPSRLYVYSIPVYGERHGMTVSEMVASEKAIAGINGGGFADKGGMGSGNTPVGIVISNGVVRYGGMNSVQQLIGFDNNNKLVVGNMTVKKALEMGIRDAVSWGPALIVNGEPVDVGNGGGLNPRSAIGQRADGAVILVSIEGRQPGSMGASYLDLIQIMTNYGAVNAANLDGGNSSSLIYDGKILNSLSSINGERYIPTGFMVKAR